MVLAVGKMLIEYGANLKVGQVTDHTILTVAAWYSSVPVLEYLLAQEQVPKLTHPIKCRRLQHRSQNTP